MFSPQVAVFTTFKWVLSFLAFDRSETRPEEEINIPALIDSFTNPEIVGGNIVTQVAFILGRVSKFQPLSTRNVLTANLDISTAT